MAIAIKIAEIQGDIHKQNIIHKDILASRIQSLTKNYGVSLLISHQTFSRLQNPADYAIRTIDTVAGFLILTLI